MHVPEITWIVVEDAVEKTKAVTNLLAKCKSITSVHLTAKSPPPPPKGQKAKDLGRGVNQRNAGLSWIRRKCGSNATEMCKGVVYLMDDDNKYDLRLFEEVGQCMIWARSKVNVIHKLNHRVYAILILAMCNG